MQRTIPILIDTTIKHIVECEQLIKRGDTLILKIKVFNNAVLADFTNQSIDLILKKSDGKNIEKTITSVVNGTITATLDVQATVVPGIVQGEAQICDTNGQVSTNTFTFIVDPSFADDVLAKSEDSIETLSQLKNTITDGNTAIQKYKENVTAIAGTAEAVEALNGTKKYIDINLSALQAENAKAVVNIKDEKAENDKAAANIITLGELNNNSEKLKLILADLIEENKKATDNISAIKLENIKATDNIKNLTKQNNDTENLTKELETTITNAETKKQEVIAECGVSDKKIAAMQAFGDVTQVSKDIEQLKEDKTSLLNKVDKVSADLLERVQKTSVINNLLTTEVGYVLDARQGKIIQDEVAVLQKINNIASTRVSFATLGLTTQKIIDINAITNGIGFKPRKITIFGVIPSTNIHSQLIITGVNQGISLSYLGNNTITNGYSQYASLWLGDDTTNYMNIAINSITDTGFTFSFYGHGTYTTVDHQILCEILIEG